jgi:hypothetical protein
MSSLYEKLIRACLWEWFTTNGELKSNYKHVVEVGTSMKSNKNSMHVMKDYPEVCDSLIVMLRKMKKVVQLLSTSIMQPIFHGMKKFVAFDILHEGPGEFTILENQFMKTKYELVFQNVYNNSK